MFMRLMNIVQIASLQQIIVKEDLQLLTEHTYDPLSSGSFFYFTYLCGCGATLVD